MKFLPHLDKENIMLVNTIYHNGRKATDYNDYLDIIYKDLRTGEKFVETIETPEMEVYFAKEDARDYDYNKSFIELESTEMHKCKFKDLPFYIAKQGGDSYVQWIKDCLQKGNRGKINNIHKYRYVFGSDYDIENWYKIQWVLHNHNEKVKPITKQFADIEVDTIDIEGFPKDGECPVNAVTIVDELDNACYTFLLRNDKNSQIEEFENTIDSFIDELHEAFDETYGALDYRIYMYDDEIELIKAMFRLINTLKRDFLMIWNMGFDIPYVIARIIELGLDPVEIMCHKDFKIKELFYKKDMLNYAVMNKSDYFKISSYTVYADQMLLYAGLRKGQGELRSYSLNSVASTEIKDEKLDYSEDANIKTLPYVDYKKFVMYNIKDVLLQLGIERKTGDIDNVYQRAYSNATSYHKIFKQTVFLKNRAYIEYYSQGLIIGNNTNIEYGIDRNIIIEKDDEEEDEKFDGALVANPTLNEHTGIDIFGAQSMFIFDNTVDMDFSSMYPHIMIAFNIAPNCMVGKLLIDSNYRKILNANGSQEDNGKHFVDDMIIGNVANMGTHWFNLPGITELDAIVQEKLNVNKQKKVNIDKRDADYYYLEELIVD